MDAWTSMDYMRPYSEDLRTRIVETVRAGTSKSATARLFSVSLPTVKRYMRLADRGDSLEPKKGSGRVPKTNETTRKLLEEDIKERSAATIAERRLFLEKVAGQSLSISTVKRLLKRLGFSQKNGLWGRWNEMSSKGQPGE
ncbi:helix-turn-helix domain-containing protein [Rubrobacter aplysinae]|uniref:helix-turn-helix domain-containing protein n=1 Tax=Rubrobacter aplysinae TaxID=909625 RepID=UPI00128DA434|nr:IS630 transposase-related protein [Rubrobacter aplysinae]